MPKTFREFGLRFIAWLLKPFNAATGRRWLDILLLGLIGSAICLLFWPLLQKVSEGAVWVVDNTWQQVEGLIHTDYQVFDMWPPAYLVCFGALAVLFSLAILSLSRIGILRLRHWASLLLYPPTWFAALWPITIITWWLPSYDIFNTTMCVLLLISVSLAFLMDLHFSGRLSWSWRHYSNAKLPTAEETLRLFAEDPENYLIPWLMRDEPVKEPEQDLFESHEYAQQIAESITDQHWGCIGLIGPRGSGKTTILNLVDFLLYRSKSFMEEYRQRWRKTSPQFKQWNPPKVLTCRVQAWGFIKESATVVVLREAVSELGKHVDCLAVRSLPDEYLAAIKGVAPAWIHAPLRVMSVESPLGQLRRLDPILKAINARLVIFIEDLDRNVEMSDVSFAQSIKNEGTNVNTEVHNDLAARPNGQLFLEIETLLDRISQAERISFVLAISRSSA